MSDLGHWVNWKNLQTFPLVVGWFLGAPAGALIAIAWGLWATQATNKEMKNSYTEVVAQERANSIRITALEELEKSTASERAISRIAFNNRLTTLETEFSPKLVTAEVISGYGGHLGALDGRLDEVKRDLLTEQTLRAYQISNICTKLLGVLGASGKKPIQCP